MCCWLMQSPQTQNSANIPPRHASYPVHCIMQKHCKYSKGGCTCSKQGDDHNIKACRYDVSLSS